MEIHDPPMDEGDPKLKNLMELMYDHKIISIEEARPQFGSCKNHSRKNEYYDMKRNKACCTMCAIEMSSGGAAASGGTNVNLVSLENAYSIAKKRIKMPDSSLEQKMQTIKLQLQHIQQQKNMLKEKAQNAK